MTNDARGLINTRKKVKIGSGDYVEAELIGNLRGIAKQKKGEETPVTLINVKYVSQLFCNLISLTSVLNKGFKVNGNQDAMTIRKANTEYMFNQRIMIGGRELAGIQIDIWNTETVGVCRGYTHAILGHPCAHITSIKRFIKENEYTKHDQINMYE